MCERDFANWMPTVVWPGALRQRFFYWAEGRAADLRGARTWVQVTLDADVDGNARINATWVDDADRSLLHGAADVGTLRTALTLKAPSLPSANAVTDPNQGYVLVERSGQMASYPRSPGVAFQWRLCWPLVTQFIPWRAGLTGSLCLFDLATTAGPPFDDGLATVDVTTEEGDVIVSLPNGGQRSVDCWLIAAAGPGWTEVACIGKQGEGLIRFDLHAADSAIMMGRAG